MGRVGEITEMVGGLSRNARALSPKYARRHGARVRSPSVSSERRQGKPPTMSGVVRLDCIMMGFVIVAIMGMV